MSGVQYTFSKEERLSHRDTISLLFSRKGKSLSRGPILLAYLETELPTSFPAQVLVSVGKKRFKRAVIRNRIKRKIKESYRLQKHQLYDVLQHKQLAILIIYTGKTEPNFSSVNMHVSLLMNELIKRYQ
jgi:ribonuclease P protein component